MTTETILPPPSLTAHFEERILAPLRRTASARTWFGVTIAAILCLHVAVLVLLIHRDTDAARQMAQREPTPIEVVVEPPKPPPAAKPQEKVQQPKPPAQKQVIEKPASSAPRVANEEKVETTSLQKETHAPKADKPPTDGKLEPSKEAASPSTDPAEPNKTDEAAAKEDVLKKDAEALDKAAPQPKPKPKKLAKATPRAKTRRAMTALAALSGNSALPDYAFARPTKKSPVTGGTEDSRYLAIVYGMIMEHRSWIGVPGDAGASVTIAFNVDDDGNVIGMGVEHTSGYSEIDAAAASAIRRASPFPPPPAGAPHGLVATVDFSEGRSMSMDERDP